jgi:hypothetical protein
MLKRKIIAAGNRLIKVWRVNRITEKDIEKIRILINRDKSQLKRNPEVVLARKNSPNPKTSQKKALHVNPRLNQAKKSHKHSFRPNLKRT